MKTLSLFKHRGFTIVEVMLAITIFGMIIVGIYSTWRIIIEGSKAGLNAAAVAQRGRISIKSIEDALLTAQMYSLNGKKHYYFTADTQNDKSGGISFVARLPATFPGVGYYGDSIVRRVSFFTDEKNNLIMTQIPMLSANLVDKEQYYSLQLAQDVTLLMFEFWDDQKKEYVSSWASTNKLPKIVRVALGLGKQGNGQAPLDLVTRTIAMPCTEVRPEWQRAQGGMMPGGPGGMPGMIPGQMPMPVPGGGMMPGGGMPNPGLPGGGIAIPMR